MSPDAIGGAPPSPAAEPVPPYAKIVAVARAEGDPLELLEATVRGTKREGTELP